MKSEDIFVEMSMDNENEVSVFITRELRVLSGLHKGAALVLSNEIITIGSDPNCTVVLLDDGIDPIHMTLQWMNGKGWANLESPDSPLQSPLRVGTVLLSIAKLGSPWEVEASIIPETSLLAPPLSPLNSPKKVISSPPQYSIRRRWAVGCIFAASLLLFSLLLFMNRRPPPIVPLEIAAASKSDRYEMATLTKDSELDNCSYVIEQEANKDVLAVVNGKDSYVLMRTGQRIYVGDSVDDMFLSELQDNIAIWRSRITECKVQ